MQIVLLYSNRLTNRLCTSIAVYKTNDDDVLNNTICRIHISRETNKNKRIIINIWCIVSKHNNTEDNILWFMTILKNCFKKKKIITVFPYNSYKYYVCIMHFIIQFENLINSHYIFFFNLFDPVFSVKKLLKRF